MRAHPGSAYTHLPTGEATPHLTPGEGIDMGEGVGEGE